MMHIVNVATLTTLRFVLPFAQKSRQLGFNVTICCSLSENIDKIKELNFPLLKLQIDRKVFSFNHFVSILRLYRFMKQKDIKILHCHTPFAALIGRMAAIFAKVPVVIYHIHGTYFDEGGFANLLFCFTEKILNRWTTAALTINRADTRDLAARKLYPNDKICYLGCGGGGVDLDAFNPYRIRKEQSIKLKSEFKINEGEKVIGFIGRMVKVKGLYDLLEAFRIISCKHGNVKLMMVGGVLESERDKSTFKNFQNDARKLGLTDRIIYTGFREDITGLLSITDVNILPSHSEWFGMVIAEAAAMGIPSVATNTRGARDAVQDGVTGLLVPLKDVHALAEAVLKLLNDNSLCRQMGARAMLRASELFDQRRLVNKVMDIYNNCYPTPKQN